MYKEVEDPRSGEVSTCSFAKIVYVHTYTLSIQIYEFLPHNACVYLCKLVMSFMLLSWCLRVMVKEEDLVCYMG